MNSEPNINKNTCLTVGAAHHAGDMLPAVLWPRRGAVAALEGARLDGVDGGANELERLVQCVRVRAARVEDDGAQLDVLQQLRVAVDLVDRKQHRLQALNAAVLVDRAAASAVGACSR